MIQTNDFQGFSSICRVEGENILLSTGMDEAVFGKTRLATTLTSDAGVFAELDKNTGTWKFSKWHFTEIHSEKTESGEIVFLSGKLPKPALAEVCAAEKTALLTVSAISAALNSNQDLNAVGSGGIIAGKDCVLFLPKNLFESSVNSLEESTRAELNGKYIFKGLSQKNELCFLRSVIAYTALSGNFPFNQIEENVRQKDIIDSLFLPIEFAVNGIDKTLAAAINQGLSPKVDYTGELQKNFPLAILQKELGISKNGEIEKVVRENAIAESEFKKLSENYFNKKNKKTRTQRFIQKNRIALIAATAALCILVYAVNGTVKRIGNLPTTRGITSFETLEQFYKAVHLLDAELLQEVSSGKDVKGILNVVSAMYVTTKTREGYSNEPTVTPEKWFALVSDKSSKKQPWMYGLTNVVIAMPGKSSLKANLEKVAPLRKDKLSAIEDDDGEIPKNGDCKKYTVKYFRIFTHGEVSILTIEKNEDYIFETFEKDRWIVTSVSSNLISSEELKMQDLRKKFIKTLDFCGGDVKKAITFLSAEYSWLPQ